ncbi:MAG: hypothetical protein NVSMB25_09940 [Thermoleophilaceae bacterium]
MAPFGSNRQSATTPAARSFAELAREWDAAWAAHDVERMLALSTPDAVWEDSTLPKPARGHDELRELYQGFFRAFPNDLVIKQEELYSDESGREHASRWSLSGTFLGEAPTGLQPTGDHISVQGVALVSTNEEGLTTRVRQFQDVVAFQRQIGAAPQPGSRAEKVMLRLQALGAKRRLRKNRSS